MSVFRVIVNDLKQVIMILVRNTVLVLDLMNAPKPYQSIHKLEEVLNANGLHAITQGLRQNQLEANSQKRYAFLRRISTNRRFINRG